jgi:mxaJ protein
MSSRSLKSYLKERSPQRRGETRRRARRELKPSSPPLRSLRLCRECAAILFVLLLGLLFQACSHGTAPPRQNQPAQAQAVQPEAPIQRPADVLRVCADPNNLPFSNRRGEGFENKLAEMLAREMSLRLEYTWWAQRRGFFRSTLKAGLCDVVMGVPTSLEMALTTAPYYRSTYVFLYRKDRGLKIASFDDPALRELKIGVQMIGDDFSNTPPAHALTNRGIVENVRGYMVYGDYARETPAASIVEAVESREVDVAVVWGPLAGYFARRRKSLEIVPVKPEIDQPFLPFVYDISVGVRRTDQDLRDRIEGILQRKRPEIRSLLKDYGIPEKQG